MPVPLIPLPTKASKAWLPFYGPHPFEFDLLSSFGEILWAMSSDYD